MIRFIPISIIIFLVLMLSSPASAQWKHTNGPYGGDITAIAASEASLYVGTRAGILYRSSDNGETWAQLHTNNGSQSINGIVTLGTTLFFSTFNSTYSSSDNGITWIPVDISTNCEIYKIGTTIYNGIGIIRYSVDTGKTWSLLKLNFNSGLSKVLDAGTSHLILTYDSVYQSFDNNQTWKNVGSTRIIIDNAYSTISFSSANSTTLFISFNTKGLYRSLDLGVTWTLVNKGIEGRGINSLIHIGSVIFLGTTKGLFRSSDNGSTWSVANEGLKDYPVSVLTVQGTTIFAGTSGGGLFRSTDNGATWTITNITNLKVYQLIADGTTVFAGTDFGVFSSSDEGESWMLKGMANKRIISFIKAGTSLFAGTAYGQGLYRSVDNGENWIKPVNNISNGYVQSFASIGTELFCYRNQTKGSTIYRSIDNGDTWSVVYDSDISIWPTELVTSLGSVGTTLFAGKANASLDSILRSTDNGTTWERLAVGLNLKDAPIVASTGTGNTILAGTSGKGIYRSTDNGETWKPASQGLLNNNVNAFHQVGSTIYAATDNGVFRTTNMGDMWLSANTGQEYSHITAITSIGTKLYAGGEGVWEVEPSILSVESESMPSSSKLITFPNPATNTLTIDRTTLQFPENSHVRYTLSTLIGGKVMEFDSSEPKFTIQLDGIASGVYSLTAVSGANRSAVLVTVSE